MKKLIILFIVLSFTFQDADYLKEAQSWADKVFKLIYAVGCKHVHPAAKTFDQIKEVKKITCATSSSITYQQAGLIKKGKIVSHTSAIPEGQNILSHYDVSDLKKSLKLTVSHSENLKKGSCDFVKVMKKFKDMPSWLKQKGIMYVQDSNICISAGDNKIYSCNQTGKTYSQSGVNPLRKSGYPFKSPILWAIVPRSKGKSNVDSKTTLHHLPC